jgi:hypothetical protein
MRVNIDTEFGSIDYLADFPEEIEVGDVPTFNKAVALAALANHRANIANSGGYIQLWADGDTRFFTINPNDGLDRLTQAVDAAQERNDAGQNIYVTVNPMRDQFKRSKLLVAAFRENYVDVDSGKHGVSVEAVMTRALSFDIKPSLALMSGNGVQLRYIVHGRTRDEWQAINDALFYAFENMGADNSLRTDESRILKLPGSVAFKPGEYEARATEVLYESEGLIAPSHMLEVFGSTRKLATPGGVNIVEPYERQTFDKDTASAQGRQVTLFRYLSGLRGRDAVTLNEAKVLAVAKADEIGYGDDSDHVETPEAMADRIWRSYVPNESSADSEQGTVGATSTEWDFVGDLNEAEEYGDVMPNYLIHGLEPGELGAIFAAVNVGKSTLSRNLCISLACGRPYLNLTISGEPVKTLLLNFEGGRKRFYREINSMKAGLDSYERDLVRENFKYVLHDNPDHRIEGKRLDLKNPTHRAVLTDRIKRGGFKLVVIDTITAAIQFKNENSNEEWQEYTKWLEDIAVETQACVLFIHHEGKRGLEHTGQSAPRAHRGRGGSANSQLAQLVINLEAREDKGTKFLVMGLGKLKDEPVDDLIVEHGHQRWLTEIPSGAGVEPDAPQTNIEKVLAVIRQHPEGITRKEIAVAANLTESSVKTCVRRLKDSRGGLITVQGKAIFPGGQRGHA